MDRLFVILSGVYGLLAVALGAFGAHGLARLFARADSGAQRAEWWQTASHYHLTHALALGLVAWLVGHAPGLPSRVAGWCFAAGIVLFSGSLYIMALTGARWLGAVTPFGGLLLMAGWLAIVIAAVRHTAG